MMYPTPERGANPDGIPDERSSPARDGRTFARRIECDGSGAAARGAARPARGGGLRDPEAWESRRAHGR